MMDVDIQTIAGTIRHSTAGAGIRAGSTARITMRQDLTIMRRGLLPITTRFTTASRALPWFCR